MNEKLQQAFADALYSKDPDALKTSLENGASPYSVGALGKPALFEIIFNASIYAAKLDYVRPLVQAGNDFDLIREETDFGLGRDLFDQSVLSLGTDDYRKGDEECAGFVLAHLIAHDLEKNRGYELPIDRVLSGIGKAAKTPGSDEERTRYRAAAAITRNQHALADYVSKSEDPVAAFLRTCSDHPHADVWMRKIEPVDPDRHSRPTQQFIDAVRNADEIAKEMLDNPENSELGEILKVDWDMNEEALNRMSRSWKPGSP